MKHIAILAFLALPLAAQTTQPLVTFFVPSGEMVGGFERIGIKICNPAPIAQVHTGYMLMRDAAANGIMVATHEEMLRAGVRADSMSTARIAALALEVAGTTFTVLTAGGTIKINEAGYKIIAPVGAGALRAFTTYFKSQEYVAPTDMRPPLVTVPPDGACVDYAVYGTVKGR